jgi:hypothetical protein
MLKPKILPDDIEGLTFIEYRKMFIKELKRMKSACSEPGQHTNFMIMTEWNFPDQPGKDIPFIVVGDFRGTWEKYYKNSARKRSQKDFAFGNASFGNQTQAGEEFNLEIRHGRVKPKGVRVLDKVIMNKIGMITNVLEKGGAANEEDETDVKADVAKTGMVTSGITSKFGNAAKEKKEKAPKKEPAKNKEERIEDIKQQTDELKSATEEIKAKFAVIKKDVSAKVKKGNITRKELLAVRDLQDAFTAYVEAFDNADPKLQEKFAKAKNALDKQNKEFAKLALVVKAKKKTLAQQLADKYFEKKGDRTATPEEVSQMHQSLKAAIDYRQIALREGDEKQLNLKAIYITAQMKGPAFRPTHTNVVYEKLMQPR